MTGLLARGSMGCSRPQARPHLESDPGSDVDIRPGETMTICIIRPCLHASNTLSNSLAHCDFLLHVLLAGACMASISVLVVARMHVMADKARSHA